MSHAKTNMNCRNAWLILYLKIVITGIMINPEHYRCKPVLNNVLQYLLLER